MENNTNTYGVKVGDLFSATWGYDQTNVDFFQVVSLAGKCSVRVRQVRPQLIKREAICGQSCNCVYERPDELLPPSDHSIFIDDQEKGDLKRLKSCCPDNSKPFFVLTSYCDAYLVTSDIIRTYESWYA